MDLKQFSFFAFNLLFGAVIDMASGVFFARRAKSQRLDFSAISDFTT